MSPILATILMLSAGELPPERQLYLTVRRGEACSERLIAETKRDNWLNQNFQVHYVYLPLGVFAEPTWRTDDTNVQNPWPRSPNHPNGCFVTSGFATLILKRELRAAQRRRVPYPAKWEGKIRYYNWAWDRSEEPLPES